MRNVSKVLDDLAKVCFFITSVSGLSISFGVLVSHLFDSNSVSNSDWVGFWKEFESGKSPKVLSK